MCVNPQCITCKRYFSTLNERLQHGECRMKKQFETKDSGKRETFETGMERDTNDNKPRYDLIWLPGLRRVAELMARGAKKYTERNWEKACTEEELNRFKESLLRHTFQYLEGDRSEDHMAAIVFNAFGAEMVKEKLKNG